MRKLSLALAALALITLHSPAANAVTFDWSYTGDGISGSGTFDAADSGTNQFVIDAITGTANGQTITGIANYAAPDQNVYTLSPYLDFGGVAFTVTGGQAYNFYYLATSTNTGVVNGYDCGYTGYCLIGPGTVGTSGLGPPQDVNVPIDFTMAEVTATPLPAALPLFMTAFGVLALLAYRKKST